MKTKILLTGLVILISSCKSAPIRLVEDSSGDRPKWVNGAKVTWAEGDQIFFRQQYSVRGDERLNGCYQLAKLEAKETVVREIKEDIRGQIDSAQQGLSENSELLLSQVRSSEFSGSIKGMRVLEQYHERYVSNGTERLDCYVLSMIKQSDYDNVKRQVLFKLEEADPALKDAIKNRSLNFFTGALKKDLLPDVE